MWDCGTKTRSSLQLALCTAPPAATAMCMLPMSLTSAATHHSSHITETDFHHCQPFLTDHTYYIDSSSPARHTQIVLGSTMALQVVTWSGDTFLYIYLEFGSDLCPNSCMTLCAFFKITLASEKYFANMSSLPLFGFIILI